MFTHNRLYSLASCIPQTPSALGLWIENREFAQIPKYATWFLRQMHCLLLRLVAECCPLHAPKVDLPCKMPRCKYGKPCQDIYSRMISVLRGEVCSEGLTGSSQWGRRWFCLQSSVQDTPHLGDLSVSDTAQTQNVIRRASKTTNIIAGIMCMI